MKNDQIFWERCARFYTSVQERKAQNLYQTLIECIIPQLQPDMDVLEIGCGTGQLSLPLAPYVRKWIATDFSSNMIAELSRRNIPNNLHPSLQDANRLPYDAKQFDVVVIANVLHILPEPEKALAEAYRVLRYGGLFIAPTFVKDEFQNKWKLWIMKQLGFKIYHNWTVEEYSMFIRQFHLSIESIAVIPGNPSSECLLMARR